MTFYISRFKNMNSVEFDLEVVTPMFLGGANNFEAELRIPSIKGMLRFWWRATCGIASLNEMKGKEAEIFGATEKKASFSMQIGNSDKIEPILRNLPQGWKVPVENKKFKIGTIDYLAFGIRDHKEGYTRKHIPSGDSFKIKFIFYDKNHQKSILEAFYALINNGGIGAKNRNGFGSLCLENPKKLDFSAKERMKGYTALSNKSILFNNFKVHEKWEDALSEIGLAYRAARLSVEKKHNYDKRLLIAKPIVQTGNSQERHAKPYFLHVNKLDNAKFQGQILFMPYQYYQPEKRNEYMQVCNKMNKKIAELSKG